MYQYRVVILKIPSTLVLFRQRKWTKLSNMIEKAWFAHEGNVRYLMMSDRWLVSSCNSHCECQLQTDILKIKNFLVVNASCLMSAKRQKAVRRSPRLREKRAPRKCTQKHRKEWKRWTDEDVQTLNDLTEKGMSSYDIGKTLHRTQRAIESYQYTHKIKKFE